MTWSEFVQAMSELGAATDQIDFVMRVDDNAVVDFTGRLLVKERLVDPGGIQFSIEEPAGQARSFFIPEDAWVGADWLAGQGSSKALEIRTVGGGQPVFSLHVSTT